MENKGPPPKEQKVWIRHPHRNNGSLSVTIPAGIRRQLNWHMNAIFLIELVGDHMEVRQLDQLKLAGAELETKTMRRRRKSWKRGPQEEERTTGGYVVESPQPETEDR